MRGIEHIPWLYQCVAAGMDALGLARWREDLAQGARGRTLEIGCGTGRNFPLYPASAQVIGLDPDVAALKRAQRRAPHLPLLVGRAEALPFADGSFDTVVSSLVFCSVSDPLRGLAEIRRVLRPDGELRMLEHVRARRRFWAALQDRIQPVWTWVSGGCHPNRDIEVIVERSGFHIQTHSYRARHLLRLFAARVRM
ncbi:MAG: class I SAM-dependent methyltransferase [Phycisphaerae bacterium]